MKAYHISFRFDQPQPGVISIPANNPEEAVEKLKKLLDGFSNVYISEVVDLDEVPMFKALMDKNEIEDIEIIEPNESSEAESLRSDNLKKPN